MITRPRRPAGYWVERILALAVVLSLAWSFLYLYRFGYLPQPFFYEPSDTWMDWFNTAYWAHNPGAYDTWGTIYPPLSFLFLKVLTNPVCYPGAEGLPSRACDTYGVIAIHAIFLVNCWLVWKSFRKIDPRTAAPRTIALCLGMPMAYGLERGNLILLAFTFMLLAYGPLVRSARLRWIAAACAVNMKVYLIGSIFAQLLHRRWRWFEGALVATIIVYLASYAILGDGTPWQIYDNITDFSSGWQAASLLDLWYTSSYKPVLSLLNGSTFPVVGILGSRFVDVSLVVVTAAIHAVQASIVLAAVASWFRPEAVPPYRLVFLAVALALITSEAGGYTQVLLILFVFMEPWKGFGRKFAIISAYVLCLANDIKIDSVPPAVSDSFLAGGPRITEHFVGIGPFLRPAIVLAMAFALAMVTIRDAWIDLRRQGWRLGRRPGTSEGSFAGPLPAERST